MKKSLLLSVGIAVAALTLVAVDRIRQFRQSIDYYVSGISAPRFSSGFLEVPVKISLINHSQVGFSVEDFFITIYQFSESGWKNHGRSNPRPEGISLPAGRTTEITLTPRVAILSGILPNLLSLIQGGINARFRVGLAV